jgi:hypothetical protein
MHKRLWLCVDVTVRELRNRELKGKFMLTKDRLRTIKSSQLSLYCSKTN